MPNNKTPKADSQNIADLRSAADIIEEVSDSITYLGFCEPGTTDENSPSWSIMRIEQAGIVQPLTTRFKWANGLCAFNLSWTKRAEYNYKYKSF